MKEIKQENFEKLFSQKYNKKTINLEDNDERQLVENIILMIYSLNLAFLNLHVRYVLHKIRNQNKGILPITEFLELYKEIFPSISLLEAKSAYEKGIFK